jgi:hypothetical protein
LGIPKGLFRAVAGKLKLLVHNAVSQQRLHVVERAGKIIKIKDAAIWQTAVAPLSRHYTAVHTEKDSNPVRYEHESTPLPLHPS